jgi:D-alanyl-D-alanine carboxypeptidase
MAAMIATTAHAEKSGITFPRATAAQIGVVVRNLSTGTDIVSENADKLLTPASITKCVTAASILLDNRENATFTTSTDIIGQIDESGTLWGDVIVHASGDPTTESQQFDTTHNLIDSIASNIKRLGIRKIQGALEIDSLAFKQQGPVDKWEVEDLKWAYGAGLYPLNYHDNTVNGDRAISDPGEAFLTAIEHRLANNGISIEWEALETDPVGITPVYTYTSPTLSQIMRVMIEKSNNLYAESMLRQLAPNGYRADALARENELLVAANLNCDNLNVNDGSGLTRSNKLTPGFMADMLQYMSKSDKAELYLSLFPKVGEEGTVKRLLANTSLAGKLIMKSGSMNGVQCYAGYKLDDNNRPTHIVVIMVNNFTCQRSYVTKAISNFLLSQF